ncbi:hypothetical protein NL676_009912 [Syzygium grande]|nr:hypothetical protein NL676_009912 [Syzygium grande]
MRDNSWQDGICGAVCLIPNIEVDLSISSEGLGYSHLYFPFLNLQEYQQFPQLAEISVEQDPRWAHFICNQAEVGSCKEKIYGDARYRERDSTSMLLRNLSLEQQGTNAILLQWDDATQIHKSNYLSISTWIHGFCKGQYGLSAGRAVKKGQFNWGPKGNAVAPFRRRQQETRVSKLFRPSSSGANLGATLRPLSFVGFGGGGGGFLASRVSLGVLGRVERAAEGKLDPTAWPRSSPHRASKELNIEFIWVPP